MEHTPNAQKLFDLLLDLYARHSDVHRRTISFDKFTHVMDKKVASLSEVPIDSPALQESLLEHVGVLPVIATALHPYLHHKEKIDIGRVLTMLAIHDIGELVVGDAHPHHKSGAHVESEYQAALSLLDVSYHELLAEYEARETYDAKFAKSVDLLSTFLADQLLPIDAVHVRHAKHGFSWSDDAGQNHTRHALLAWDGVLMDLSDEIVARYQAIGHSNT